MKMDRKKKMTMTSVIVNVFFSLNESNETVGHVKTFFLKAKAYDKTRFKALL